MNVHVLETGVFKFIFKLYILEITVYFSLKLARFTLNKCRGATLHQKVVVTGSGTYGERVEREPITGVCVQGQSPWWGQGAKPPEVEKSWQNNVKICT